MRMASDSGLWPSEGNDWVHFVGIGGVRMSALAEMLARKGCRVTGSDCEASIFTERVEKAGATVYIGHAHEQVGDVDAVVFTPAVDPENPELIAARERGIRIIEGKKLLGEMTRGKRLIAVSGTHGKTTTTAMITQICDTAGLDPTSFVGGAIQGDESNLRIGDGDLWIVEADEYDRALLELKPTVAVVTSLEADHLDLYGSEDEIVETFDQFLSQVTDGGSAVRSVDYDASRTLNVPVGRRDVTFGMYETSALAATQLEINEFETLFTVKYDGDTLGTVLIRIPGEHNVLNALGAIGAALSIDVNWDSIQTGLNDFRGVRRRFEIVGEVNDVTVVNDYAHHPTEIDKTIQAARDVRDGRVVAIFQPHLYSRTRDFAPEFSKALTNADVCWLTDIYPARELPIEGISGRTIAEGIDDCHYEADLDRLADAVVGTLEEGDTVLVMGAGSIDRVASEVLERLPRGRCTDGQAASPIRAEGPARRERSSSKH